MQVGTYSFVSQDEEATLRDDFSYTDADLQMLSQGRFRIKSGEELCAMASQNALVRRNGGVPREERNHSDDGSGGASPDGGTVL